MLKRIILSILMLGFVTQVVPVKAGIVNKEDLKYVFAAEAALIIGLLSWDYYRNYKKNQITKNHLSKPLQEFLKDFETWTQEEKNTIQFSSRKNDSLEITINGLGRERQVAYEGDLNKWLKYHLLESCLRDLDETRQPKDFCLTPYVNNQMNLYLEYLKNCIEYLRQ